MHKTPALLAALTISAAALAGCSSGEDPEAAARDHVQQLEADAEIVEQRNTGEVVTAAEEPPLAPSLEGVSSENTWAEKQLLDYMKYQGANSLEGFSKGSPERNIIAVTNPEDGVVRFVVRDRDYEADGWFLDATAINFMSYTGCAAEDVDSVIVETESGAETATRDGCP